ncbi:MAG: hypothetical protein OXF74_06720 [Rhodobacteraceae bacterium]|nr:hypothetical protein [Paracoccaceae bacterium]
MSWYWINEMSPTWIKKNLTERERVVLAEVEATPVPDPVEPSPYMKAKVQSEQAVNNAAAERIMAKKKAAAAAEKARGG